MTENNSKITKALLSDFVNQGFCEPQVQEIALGLEEKLPINVYAKQCYNWMQMREIRLGLAEQLDINYYANPLFSANQMREIRIGLKLCVDVSQYANLMFSVTDMRQTRHKLMKEAYKKDNSRFDGVIFDEESQINIRLSDNSMNAYITIPAMTSTGYTVFDLIKLLKKYDIVYGVIEENLRNAVGNNICNQEIKVAEGKRSQIGKSGRYELFFQNDLPDEPLALPDGRVDYSNIIVAETVEEGQILAQYYKKQPGKRGMTVTGISVNGKYGRELSGLTGNNIVVEKDADIYRAATRGYVSFDSLHYELNVWPVYEIDGDVNRYENNVEFDGTVHIKGSVGGNASITASGDVIIDHFVEGAYIKAGRNIIIKGGVNASGKGRLEAKKKIMGNFFESATLVAKGQIEGNYFLNCNIVTDNLLIAKGKKGRIMGGSIIAAVGVEAVTIGNLGSEQTVFYVGDLVRIQKEINDCKQKKKEDEERLRTLLEDFDKVLKVSVKGNDNGEILRKIEIAIQIEKKKIQTFKDEIERLRIVKKRAKKAYVRVWGHLYSNVIFTINDYKKIIKNDVCGVFLTGEKSDRR